MLIHSIALILAAILIMSTGVFATSSAQGQQGEIQQESDGGLTATLNGDSFTTGDTITISGTVEEREIRSAVAIEVIGPNSQTVETGYPQVTADNTFTYSFEAGVNNEFDVNPMEESGNYRVIVRYQQPGEEITSEDYFAEVEFVFAYQHVEGGVQLQPQEQEESDTTTTTVRRTINVTAIIKSVTQGLDAVEQLNTSINANGTRLNMLTHLNTVERALQNIQGNLTGVTPLAQGEVPVANNTTGTAATTPSRPPPQQSESQQQVGQQQNVEVSIVPRSSSLTDTAFQPNPVQVSVGDTVTWTNNDSQPHTVTSGSNGVPDNKFNSSPNFNPLMAPGATFSHTFAEAGEYPYFCMLHPNQVGTVSAS
jgi:plastocyanin